MGADFISSGLWKRPDTELDFGAARAAIDSAPRDELEALADQCCLDPDDPDDPDGVQERARFLLGVIEEHADQERASRDLVIVCTPDRKWHYYYTGGTSWGDSPNELFDAFNDLFRMPSVIRALGFWAPQEGESDEPGE